MAHHAKIKWLALAVSALALCAAIYLCRPVKGEVIRTSPAFPASEDAFWLNEADEEALLALPGVGEKLAGRILHYRETHGGFSSVDELIYVDGIGEKTLDNILKYLSEEKGQ